jgi:hypothetical protein
MRSKINNINAGGFMKLTKVILLVGLLSVVTMQCSKKDSEGNQIMPLSVGNVWEFVDENGRDATSIRIVDRVDIDGQKWYRSADQVCFRNGNGGLWAYYEYDNNYELVFKYPASIGDIYNIDEHGYDSVKVVSKDTRVSVPAGEFDCYHYVSYSGETKYDQYACPGIGLVKMTYSFYGSVYEFNLEYYSLK